VKYSLGSPFPLFLRFIVSNLASARCLGSADAVKQIKYYNEKKGIHKKN
jgi:hypothetical protein